MNAMKAAFCCMLLSLVSPTWAVNGFSVSISYTTGGYNGLHYGGKVVRFDIQGDAVTARTTIYDGLAWYPAISFDGTRVAFFRAASTSRWDTGYVSIVNKDGTGLKDLVKLYAGQYGYSCNYVDCESGFLSWPAGEWVYYEKPPKTGEIWRVNVNDPSLNHLVVRYNDAGVRPGNCACDISGNEGFWLRRWQLSKDARHCSGMFKTYPQGQELPHRFPPPEGYAPFSMAVHGNLVACNLCMSPSGAYVSSYFAGCHDFAGIHVYDYAANFLNIEKAIANVNLYTDVRTWCGRDVGNLGEYLRWAANSDKWQIWQASYNCNGGGSMAANQILCNWKDRKGICPSTNTSGSSTGQDAGDFWIDDPTNNPNKNKYEDANGNWVQVTARDIYLTWAVSGSNPYQVSISAYPADADIRYTTDGSDPAQTSSKYTGTLNLVPTAGQVMQVKARAFRTGMNPAETESRLLAPTAKNLPAGYIKELLCLENAQGAMIVPAADTAGVKARYAGENKAVPFDGDQVTVNGHGYTWHLRTSANGIWSPATASSSLTFWYTTIVSPSSRMVDLGVRFHSNPVMFCNGFPVTYFEGWDSNQEWTFGSGDYTCLGLLQGANGVLMQQNADGAFAVRFLDLSEKDITDLRYFPYTGIVQSNSGRGHGRPLSGATAWISRGDLHIAVEQSGAHTISIYNLSGRTIRTIRGTGVMNYRIAGKELGGEPCLVSVKMGAGEIVRRIHCF